MNFFISSCVRNMNDWLTQCAFYLLRLFCFLYLFRTYWYCMWSFFLRFGFGIITSQWEIGWLVLKMCPIDSSVSGSEFSEWVGRSVGRSAMIPGKRKKILLAGESNPALPRSVDGGFRLWQAGVSVTSILTDILARMLMKVVKNSVIHTVGSYFWSNNKIRNPL